MKEASNWTVPKWPFLLGNATLLGFAGWIVLEKASHPITDLQIVFATASVGLGAVLGALPYILEYRGASKLVEVNALTTVVAQLEDLQKYAGQVSAATDQWARVQEATQGGAEKTTAAAREIADRMAVEIRSFNEFQAKLNDGEKNAMRLEVEKLRRSEGDWLQVLARILDHIFALYTAASRSGQPEVAAQIGQFQIACRDAARRVGMVPFVAEANEPFDPQRHRAHGVEHPQADDTVAETMALGFSFQGRLIRPALVRLQPPARPEPEPVIEPAVQPAIEPAPEPAASKTPVTDAPAPEPAPAPVPAAAAQPEPAPAAIEEEKPVAETPSTRGGVGSPPPAAASEEGEAEKSGVTMVVAAPPAVEAPVETQEVPAAAPATVRRRSRNKDTAKVTPKDSVPELMKEPVQESPAEAPVAPVKEPAKEIPSPVVKDLFDLQ